MIFKQNYFVHGWNPNKYSDQGQSKSKSNQKEGVLHTFQIFRIRTATPNAV